MALLLRNARRFAGRSAPVRALAQPFSAQPELEQPASEEVTVKINDYKAHLLDPPPTEVTTSKGELMDFFRSMYRMRRHAQPCFCTERSVQRGMAEETSSNLACAQVLKSAARRMIASHANSALSDRNCPWTLYSAVQRHLQ